jgi:serine/threonine protein kinase
VLHQIGVGALGPVFRTYEPSRDRLVAVKVFRLDITPEQAQALAEELQRAAEAGLFHPSIVEPLAAGVEGTVAYRAEEYVAAETLDVAMRHYAPASLEKVLPFITQLAGAIDFARAAGVGHGALHPRDIFVTPDEARATGFGVVDALDRVGLRAPVRRPYSAPERIASDKWRTPADVFSLAAIAFELLTGRRPSGTGTQIGSMESGPEAARLHDVLARAMHDDPAKRYATALAFAGALEGSSVTTAVATQPSAVPTVPEPVIIAPKTDDIAAEREEDEAHWELSRHEASVAEIEAEESPTLFEDSEVERAADELVLDAANLTLAESLGTPMRDDSVTEPLEDDFRGKESRAARVTGRDYDMPLGDRNLGSRIEETEPQRSSILPIAVTLVLGLLLGFGAAYAVLSRTARQETVSPPDSSTQGSAATAGKEYSERTVTQPPARSTTRPPSRPPEVPSETGAATVGTATKPTGTTAAASSNRPTVRIGRVVVRSAPSGANVTLNGKWRGRTPLILDDLAFGDYVVRIVAPGHDVAREEFKLSPDAPARTVSRKLVRSGTTAQGPLAGRAQKPTAPPRASESLTGGVYVNSRPRGAKVFIDGKEYGTTPLRIPEIRIGAHVVRLELPNHRTWTNSVRVTAGAETPVTGSLEPIR